MKLTTFDAPGRNGDFAARPALARQWSDKMSGYFDDAVERIAGQLPAGARPQFYNPVVNGSAAPDVGGAAGVITWNGFPRRFLGAGPGQPPRYAQAEPTPQSRQARPQDEYLEWFVTRQGGKITSVTFTCEGWDYYDFLGDNAPDLLLGLYQRFVSPAVALGDLMRNGRYDRLNRWNTRDGLMHLTERANNLGAEVTLAADATVRRRDAAGVEITSAVPLTRCAQFGDPARNSDPAIGAAVNALARQGRMITLADPVGLYIDRLDDSGFRLPDGSRPTGWFKQERGGPGLMLRARFAPPAGSAFTVSDVRIGGEPIKFGGQIARHVTMKLTGVASVATSAAAASVPCVGAAVGVVQPVVAPLAPAGPMPTRGGNP